MEKSNETEQTNLVNNLSNKLETNLNKGELDFKSLSEKIGISPPVVVSRQDKLEISRISDNLNNRENYPNTCLFLYLT